MVIFMSYYRQPDQVFNSHSRTRPSSTVSNGQNNTTTPTPLNSCRIVTSILCRFAFSLFLLIIAFSLFRIWIDNPTNQNEGSSIIAIILLIIAIVSFIRTYKKLRQYYLIMDTRRRIMQVKKEKTYFHLLISSHISI
jgi:hypothetical protein